MALKQRNQTKTNGTFRILTQKNVQLNLLQLLCVQTCVCVCVCASICACVIFKNRVRWIQKVSKLKLYIPWIKHWFSSKVSLVFSTINLVNFPLFIVFCFFVFSFVFVFVFFFFHCLDHLHHCIYSNILYFIFILL